MDLRKNLPVQNGNPPPPVKGSKKAFLSLVGGLVAIVALLFSMQSNYQYKPNAPEPAVAQKRVAEVMNQGKSSIWQNATDLLSQGSNKLKKNASTVIAQRTKPPQPALTAQTGKPPQSAPKPVAPRPSGVASSAGKTKGFLTKAIQVGKIGLAIITKGKVKIR